jgi:hypothetical protein
MNRLIMALSLAIWLVALMARADVVSHPDGIIGKPGGQIFGEYASSSSERSFYVRDHQAGGVAIAIPAISQLTIKGYYFLDHRDSLFHNYGLGIVLYSVNPIAPGKKYNSDGRIGYPVLSADFGARIPDPSPNAGKWRSEISILMPLARRFSLGIGSKFYRENDKRLIDKYAGLLNIYFGNIANDNPYSNPDGAEGSIALHLKAGGSGNGTFFQIDILCPLKPQLSVGTYLRGEKIKLHNIKTASLGFLVNYYPAER